ncbi:MAG: ribosome maturation factor RimP [Cycloclasticus sp.]|jgi:ribosome maturation factor RimP|nr:ribosome maturation factor RimP [Cycloclasticus sp.]|tara:strand:- start:30925 stop:31383 length:459 start_codon:yes stop_codon:yes gene_type:complete
MNQAPAKILDLIKPAITGLGYEFVGAEFSGQGKSSVLRVYIDSENGILVGDCSKVSHQISGVLDVEDPISGQYTLEVSSPGLERPLFSVEDFARFKGSLVKLELSQSTLEGQRRFTGNILDVKDEIVHLHVDDEEIEIPFSRIKKAKLVVNY